MQLQSEMQQVSFSSFQVLSRELVNQLCTAYHVYLCNTPNDQKDYCNLRLQWFVASGLHIREAHRVMDP